MNIFEILILVAAAVGFCAGGALFAHDEPPILAFLLALNCGCLAGAAACGIFAVVAALS